eukprot:m.355520 g.355520  ORF g.355520 m.355520 type:complete len:207 (-) comp17271_c0_seq1:2383-3003(-)
MFLLFYFLLLVLALVLVRLCCITYHLNSPLVHIACLCVCCTFATVSSHHSCVCESVMTHVPSALKSFNPSLLQSSFNRSRTTSCAVGLVSGLCQARAPPLCMHSFVVAVFSSLSLSFLTISVCVWVAFALVNCFHAQYACGLCCSVYCSLCDMMRLHSSLSVFPPPLSLPFLLPLTLHPPMPSTSFKRALVRTVSELIGILRLFDA